MKIIIDSIGELSKKEAKEFKFIAEKAINCVNEDEKLDDIEIKNIDRILERIITECKDRVFQIASRELEEEFINNK